MTCNLKLRGFFRKQGIGFRTVVRSSRVSSVVSPDLPRKHRLRTFQDNRRKPHLAFSVPTQVQVVQEY